MLSTSDAHAWEEALRTGAAALGRRLPPAALEAYRQHYALLRAHNARAGLTSITDPVEVAIKHYLDSLMVELVAPLAPGETLADLGPGAGFPGMVLAIAHPEAQVTLVESSAKRADFLRLAAEELGLGNVTVLGARAEEAGQDPGQRERFDLVTARAVAALPVLLEYGLPLVRVGGRFVAMKGPETEEEIGQAREALELLGGKLAAIHRLSLPRGLGERTLLLFEKIAPTPARYPRKPGLPAKRPLG